MTTSSEIKDSVLPPTEGRVPYQSYNKHNKAITDTTITNLARMEKVASSEVDARLKSLAKEFDMERTLELNAAIAGFTSLLLGLFVSSRWFGMTAIVLAFLAQHAIQGYCPPMIWFRAYGWRTAGEIEDEMTALKLLHGRALPVLTSSSTADRKQLLDEMIESKHRNGRFLGQGPLKIVGKDSKEE